MKDTYRHQGQRKGLVKILKSKGIKDQKVLSAINTIPRHWFIPADFESYAYQDNAFPIERDKPLVNLILLPIKRSYFKLKLEIKYWK